MTKILVISPLFPTPDIYSDLSKDPRSKFLYNYVKSWCEQGHEVQVINPISTYPRFVNLLLILISRIIPRFSRYIQRKEISTPVNISISGFDLIREPIIKYMPHRKLNSILLNLLARKINSKCSEFIKNADVVFLDYLSPSVDFIDKLDFKKSALLCPIIHITDEKYIDKYNFHYKKLLESSSVIFFRNKSLGDRFMNAIDLNINRELMYSGTPNSQSYGTIKNKVRNLIFAGRLIESKNVQHTIEAISFLSENIKNKISFKIVGDGYYKQNLIDLSKKYQLEDVIEFKEKVRHEDVFDMMDKSDAFVMVTEETFGMVYVEAMSQGCIVIGAKKQGIDGVIVNEENGFLVDLNDSKLLADMIEKLYRLNEDEINKISKNAIITAKEMTNNNLAYGVLNKLSLVEK